MRTATVLLALGCLAPAAGCEGDDPTRVVPVENSLAFERADGSRIQFTGQPQVWCGPWEEGEVPARTLHVRVGGFGGEARWELRAVVDDVQPGQPLAFPNTFIWNQPEGVEIFVLDEPNELSTGSDRSSGSIAFSELECGEGGEVSFTIDAVLGSEFGDGPPVSVEGSFRAPVSGGP